MIGLFSKAQETSKSRDLFTVLVMIGNSSVAFERNSAIKTSEISETNFEMNCFETRTGKTLDGVGAGDDQTRSFQNAFSKIVRDFFFSGEGERTGGFAARSALRARF